MQIFERSEQSDLNRQIGHLGEVGALPVQQSFVKKFIEH